MNCRHCNTELEHVFLDLGVAPHSNAYLTKDDLTKPEVYYPLKLYVCDNCFLVQTVDYVCADELFKSDYAYFSSVSSGWLKHAKHYSDMIIDKIGLTTESFVIEIASNDGYLLRNFVEMDVPCLGIEPTNSTADVAEQLGVPVLRRFFGSEVARQLAGNGKQADLIIGNNVYAHVPDINDFTNGMKRVLKPGGTITLEFPHLMQLIKQNQFDTVYHEHYSYLSLATVCRIFAQAGLRVFDVEQLSTHGGSLRIYACHEQEQRSQTPSVKELIAVEQEQGLFEIETYLSFQIKADKVKNDLLEFLLTQKKAGKTVIAYGAAAKGNTLLNYAGVKPDLLTFVCDAAISKQGKYLPGSRIPVLKPEKINEYKPDYIIILPWNIAQEVKQNNTRITEWGGQFVVAVPSLITIH